MKTATTSVLEIRSWKFIPTDHARLRFIERVVPVVGNQTLLEFCRELRLATREEARECRRSCPCASRRNRLEQIYLWHEETELVAVGQVFFFQTRIDFKVRTFLDMQLTT